MMNVQNILKKNEKDILTWHEFFNELILTRYFAGEYEIINSSIINKCNFIIYKNGIYNNEIHKVL